MFADSQGFPAGERKQPRETDNGPPSVATMTGRAPAVPAMKTDVSERCAFYNGEKSQTA